MSLSHVDNDGKANMVDVGGKPHQHREARAEGFISLNPETIRLVEENSIKKGDVLTIASVAGIQAAKRTHELIPLCHNLNLTKVDCKATLSDGGVRVESLARCIGQTGVEMEALTAVSVALLTIYDMCKSVDKTMVMGPVRLLEKSKGDIVA